MPAAVVRASIRAAAVIALVALSRAGAQCPDGSEGSGPCRVAARPVAIDPNRVAVIPFRVTTADTLLGEGFAELLAPEFTGEGGPRSVQMSTTLSAWRRAGGGLRSPLTQDAAMRLARALGAGVLCEGSIVGIGNRLTINAALIDATTGKPIGAPTRVVGTLDSVDVLLGQLATGLIGAGARTRVADAGKLTKSPAALRAYFEGMALWRRGDRSAAERAFETSFAADTMFASAAFQRWLLSVLLAGNATWTRRTLALRDRLTPSERLMVIGVFGVGPGAVRSRADRNADLKRAAIQVDSPESWYLYADGVYHFGLPVVGPDSVVPIARDGFARMFALDSQAVGLGHLITIALRTRDTALTRRLGRIVDNLEGEDRWARGWVIAAAQRDATQLGRLRKLGPYRELTEFSGIALMDALDTPIPTALIVDGFRQLDAVSSATQRDRHATHLWGVHRARGQPLAAEQSARGRTPPHWRPSIAEGPYAAFSGDLWDDAAFMRAYGATPLADSAAESLRQCVGARLTAQRERADSLDVPALRQRAGDRCARILGIWKEFATNTLTDAAVTALDSIVTFTTYTSFSAYEHRLLSRIYEARADTVRALRAVRLYPRDFPGVWLAPTLREEGRMFLMARDTANAMRSYNHFLELRAEAEPPYVAERDSIRALVATLTRRR